MIIWFINPFEERQSSCNKALDIGRSLGLLKATLSYPALGNHFSCASSTEKKGMTTQQRCTLLSALPNFPELTPHHLSGIRAEWGRLAGAGVRIVPLWPGQLTAGSPQLFYTVSPVPAGEQRGRDFGPAFLITVADEITSYLDNRSVMFSSFIPPKTLNFFKLQTCVFSYLPNVILWTMAGLSSFRIKYCRKEKSEF